LGVAEGVDVGRDLVGVRAQFLDGRIRSPAFSTALVIAAIDECGARTSHELPPLKSMPRLKPRMPSDPRPSTMITIEIAEPDLATTDEVDRGAAVVEAAEAAVVSSRRARRPRSHGHHSWALTPACRPAAIERADVLTCCDDRAGSPAAA
jgi:hypothetical protein